MRRVFRARFERGRLALEDVVGGKKEKKPKKKHARKPVNLTLDPRLRKAGERLSETLGVRFVRLVDFALREELAKHGAAVEAEPADGAVEQLILAARGTRASETGDPDPGV